MYPQGYFHQHISAEGWQEESYERLNWADAPIEPALTPDGKPCITAVPLGDRSVLVAVWRVRLGRVHAVSARHRPRGERAVGSRAVGAPLRRRSRDAHPAGDHPRHRRRPRAEGARHRAGRLPPERRARRLRRAAAHPRSDRARRRSFDDALAEIRQTTMFTTHTPVPAGPRRVSVSAWSRSISPAAGARSAPTATGSSRSARTTTAAASQFNMTALAIRSAGSTNAVSQLHGEVTRAMFAPMWPDLPEAERPVTARHQRRARADLDRRRSRRSVRDATSAPTGSSGTTIRRSGTACWRFPTRSCGPSASRCAAICSRSSASARGSAGSRSTSASRASSPPARCSSRTR